MRFMLKCLIIQSRLKPNQPKQDYSKKITITDDEVPLLAEMLIGSWLNIGFRNPHAFGFQNTTEKESDFEYTFF